MIEIFFFSFLVALTGALTPGPVLTFTIFKSLGKKGYLAGFIIILGHAVLEFSLIMLLLLGAHVFLRNLLILTLIGIIGGVFLIIFGLLVIKESLCMSGDQDLFRVDKSQIKGYKGNSFIGGIVISLSNPFWIFWWAVIGLGFMINFGINLNEPVGLMLFYFGHELGDFAWYVPISMFAYFGGRSLNMKVYKNVLICCGLFMMGFGIYLALNIILFPLEI